MLLRLENSVIAPERRVPPRRCFHPGCRFVFLKKEVTVVSPTLQIGKKNRRAHKGTCLGGSARIGTQAACSRGHFRSLLHPRTRKQVSWGWMGVKGAFGTGPRRFC